MVTGKGQVKDPKAESAGQILWIALIFSLIQCKLQFLTGVQERLYS
jgi:hypothetical protein